MYYEMLNYYTDAIKNDSDIQPALAEGIKSTKIALEILKSNSLL